MSGFILLTAVGGAIGQQPSVGIIPKLEIAPVIDGDLGEWKMMAFSDGEWDMERLKRSPWYEPKRNKLTYHDGEDTAAIDLSARYYMAWDIEFLYLGAEVHDNMNDINDSKHESKRWYYKDAIAWFIESPQDTVSEKFDEGDHCFAFVIDSTYPDYGAWWRHGTTDSSYLEEPLPAGSVDYQIRMDPWNQSKGDYILEARIAHQRTLFSLSDPTYSLEGLSIGCMIVHCDPDGGEYGGHMLIYGKGDDDASWQSFQFRTLVQE